MPDEDVHKGSKTTTSSESLAQYDEPAKRPISRKRKACRAPDTQSPELGHHSGHFPKLKRLARKSTRDNDQQVSPISDNTPRSKAPQALTGLAWEYPNNPSTTPLEPEIETWVATTSGGPGSQYYTDASIPIHSPNMIFNHLLPPGFSDPLSFEFLDGFKFSSPDLYPVNSDPHPTLPLPSASKEKRQQSSGPRSQECPWGSLLEKIVSVELVISQLSRNAKKKPLQQTPPEGFEILLEHCVELKQSYLYLRKSVQDSKKSCKQA